MFDSGQSYGCIILTCNKSIGGIVCTHSAAAPCPGITISVLRIADGQFYSFTDRDNEFAIVDGNAAAIDLGSNGTDVAGYRNINRTRCYMDIL